MQAVLSKHFESRMPSAIRLAQMTYEARENKPEAVINVGIGNVSLPAHPAMQERMFNLNAENSPFKDGVIRYTTTAGFDETREAFKNVLAAQGFDTSQLHVQVTEGGSAAMELLIIGVCGAAGADERPLMMIDPAYTNYISFCQRTGRKIISFARNLSDEGLFTLPEFDKIEETIKKEKPGALVVIPYDNPTGQFYDYEIMKRLAELCVKYNMWMISDEAYRELYYEEDKPLVSIWGLTNKDVDGIEGRRISIDTASKVWNACGLRIGALITDNKEFHTRAVAENTANLCPNAIGQYIYGALAHEKHEDINAWAKKMRSYYREHIVKVHDELLERKPELIVSNPSASIYSVIDVKNLVDENFKAMDFVLYCASEGVVDDDGVSTTLLVAPMSGFYDVKAGGKNPGDTQFRISFVETPDKMAKVPKLFVQLLDKYLAK